MAENIRVVECMPALVGPIYKREFGCVESASSVTSGSAAVVARILVVERWQQAVRKEAHAGLAQESGSEPLTESGFI